MIVDITRIEESKVILNSDEFTIYQTIEESLEVVVFDAEKKQIDLIYNIDPSVREPIRGDISRLRQIVINLLSNAVKFTDHGKLLI